MSELERAKSKEIEELKRELAMFKNITPNVVSDYRLAIEKMECFLKTILLCLGITKTIGIFTDPSFTL